MLAASNWSRSPQKIHNHTAGCICLTFLHCVFSNLVGEVGTETFANINVSDQLVQKWPPHLANGSDLLWEDLRPDISCKNTTNWYRRLEINFPTKVFFSEITFILTAGRPVIQLRPLGLDTLRVKSFLEKISQLPRFLVQWATSTNGNFFRILNIFRCSSIS